MEEIYKPEDKEADKVELYNRENNDILGDMPNWLIHTGSHIIYGLIGLLIIFATLFSSMASSSFRNLSFCRKMSNSS